MSDYRHTPYAQRPDLVDEARRLNGTVWPEFMFHDATTNRLWQRLTESFTDYQTMWIDAEGALQSAAATC